MRELFAVAALIAVVVLGVVLAIRHERQQAEYRRRWAAEIRERRWRRAQALNEATPGPGMFRCSCCGQTKEIGEQVQMGDVLRAVQIELKPDAPIPLICDDCYTVIMGDGPVFLDKGT